MPRFFRTLICVLLICCILVNVSPIRARAAAVTTEIALELLGAFVTMYIASGGLVLQPRTEEGLTGIGGSYKKHIEDSENASELMDELKEKIELMQLYQDLNNIPDVPEDEGYKGLNMWISRGLLAATAAWMTSIALTGLEIQMGKAPDGYAYYNGHLLPFFNNSSANSYQYHCIVYDNSSGITTYQYSGQPFYVNFLSDSLYFYSQKTYSGIYYLKDGAWTYSWTGIGGTGYKDRTVIWANHDIHYKDSEAIYLFGQEPSLYETLTIEPIYITEIPTLDDGSPDPEEIENLLPTDVDFSKPLYESQKETLNEAVQEVMRQLADKELGYDQYKDSLNPTVDPGVTPDPTVPSEDVWEPPENPGQFALDLSNYFPFCIPFDLYDFVSCLRADPVAPVIEWAVPLPGGSSYSLEIDFSTFDSVAQLLRRLQLLLFCVGLAFKTRDLIKG